MVTILPKLLSMSLTGSMGHHALLIAMLKTLNLATQNEGFDWSVNLAEFMGPLLKSRLA